MMLFKIAFRNIFRNLRRSLMTASAIAVGAVALIVFGEYMAFITVGMRTGMVREIGHLTVYQRGYFDFGSGNPSAYSISDYRGVIAAIARDRTLKPMLQVVTPTVSVYGIAGNYALDASKTFWGVGFVPSDKLRMRQWDEYRMGRIASEPLGLDDKAVNRGVIGAGLARVLGLCAPLQVANCPKLPTKAVAATAAAPSVDLAELAGRDRPAVAPAEAGPKLDLLGATANGAPNVVTFYVNAAKTQGVKELDDAYVAMPLALAQQLLYGRGAHKASAIVIQLRHTQDMETARARLNALFRERGWDLEVKDFTELQPYYLQVLHFIAAIFFFIAVIMAVIVLFTIINTMSMSVMERTNEIGTLRAMGVRKSGIRRQFLLEGALLGLIGAGIGVLLAIVLSYGFNHLGLTYQPPGQNKPVPLLLLTAGVWDLRASVFLGLFAMAALASLAPASRAARMVVVDALRHV